jgi:hypothetical protein
VLKNKHKKNKTKKVKQHKFAHRRKEREIKIKTTTNKNKTKQETSTDEHTLVMDFFISSHLVASVYTPPGLLPPVVEFEDLLRAATSPISPILVSMMR